MEHESLEITANLQDQVGTQCTAVKFCFINKEGGTGISNGRWGKFYAGPPVDFEITKIWHDYECGIRMHGKPLPDQPEIEAYLDEHAYKGRHTEDGNFDLVPGDHYTIFVSEFELV